MSTTSTEIPVPRRRFRVQFSLRALLGLMLLCSVALVVYRWPVEKTGQERYANIRLQSFYGFWSSEMQLVDDHWISVWQDHRWSYDGVSTSESLGQTYQTRASWQRGWNGQLQLHGRKTYYFHNQPQVIQQYEHGVLTRATYFYADGTLWESVSFHQSAVHGPYQYNTDTHQLVGNFREGKRDGAWSNKYRVHGEWISERRFFRNGLLHGTWTWQTSAGKTLQTATFDSGRLIEWNGAPWREAVRRWYEQVALPPESRELLAQPFLQMDFAQQGTDDAILCLQTKSAREPERLLLLVALEQEFSLATSDFRDQAGETALEVVLRTALLESRTLVLRHGVICLAPICEAELNWHDRTGVSAILFPTGSAAQRAWDEIVEFELPRKVESDEWFTQLFAGTDIRANTQEFNPGPDRRNRSSSRSRLFYPPPTPAIPSLPRPRKEVLALLLTSRDWSCELRGEELVLHPYPVAKE